MCFESFFELKGDPLTGENLIKLKRFLLDQGIKYDKQIQYTYVLLNNSEIMATGSIDKNVLKCIAVSKDLKGSGLASKVVSHLVTYAFLKGKNHLFLFTKPENKKIFEDLGFYKIASTEVTMLMENKKQGINNYINRIIGETKNITSGKVLRDVGAIVANCNPFTKGHRYLIETASKQCDLVHVFILDGNNRYFSAKQRYKMVTNGVADLKNVIVHKSEDYLISPATFPTYFIKDNCNTEEVNCDLDIEIFLQYIVPNLNIKKRFVGTEPLDHVTNIYNVRLKEQLKNTSVKLIEVPRLKINEDYVSASKVRKFMDEKNLDMSKELLPSTTIDFLF